MSLEIYKPNKSNAGSAASFQISRNQKTNEPSLYVRIVRQSGWDDRTKTGSFKENWNKDGEFIALKFTETECASIMNVVADWTFKEKFSTVHVFQGVESSSKTSISFSPYEKKMTKGTFAYGLSVIRDGNQRFSISLEKAEAVLLSEFLRRFIQEVFSYKIKKQEQYSQTKS